MQPLVVVLLGIDHPGHGVDAGQEGIDCRPVLGPDTVDVGQVEDRHARRILPVVAHHPFDSQPIEQRPQLFAGFVGYPRQRLFGCRSQCSGRADRYACQGVEHRRLPDSGPSRQGEHIHLTGEPETPLGPLDQLTGRTGMVRQAEVGRRGCSLLQALKRSHAEA